MYYEEKEEIHGKKEKSIGREEDFEIGFDMSLSDFKKQIIDSFDLNVDTDTLELYNYRGNEILDDSIRSIENNTYVYAFIKKSNRSKTHFFSIHTYIQFIQVFLIDFY